MLEAHKKRIYGPKGPFYRTVMRRRLAITNKIYEEPQSDYADVAVPNCARKAVFSIISIVVGFIVIDLGSFVFDRLVAPEMGWAVFSGEELNTEVVLYRISFKLVFFACGGYLSYKIALFGKRWHPIILSLVLVLLTLVFSGDRSFPPWIWILHMITVLAGILAGGLLASKVNKVRA